MKTEKRYLFDTREESEDSRHNRVVLGMDFREIFEHSSTSTATYIHHEKLFLSEGGDSTYLAYSTHKDKPRNTLIFNLYEKFLENEFVKEVEFNTLLDISKKDFRNEVTIKKGFGISLTETDGELALIARSVETEEVGSRDMSVRIPLGKMEEGSNYFSFRASESSEEDLLPVIRETFTEGLLYHINDLVVSYDAREANLMLAMELE